MNEKLDKLVAEAILGVDTLWGGDVMNPSGTGRFIADSWFSDRPLPRAFTHEAAETLRRNGGAGARQPDRESVEHYLDAVDVPGAIEGLRTEARAIAGTRGAYLVGLAGCLHVMWELALEVVGRGEPVPYERCVRAASGRAPEPSDPATRRRRVAELLDRAGFPVSGDAQLLASVDAWRRARRVPPETIPAVAAEVIRRYDELAARHLAAYLPEALRTVPRANITFLPIRDAWFSGSMNYIGRARRDGRPEYEATYEINASLEISGPELEHLVTHEVVPGHVTTFALLQDLYVRRELHFEATILTMNTRGAALFEGIANNAILIAHGVREVEELPDADLQIGTLLSLLQDDAKNQASWLTWQEGAPQPEVARTLRAQYLVSEERADKLSGAWGRHPLLGRMYLPLYRFGTEKVAALRRLHAPEDVLPALYGVRGLADLVTIEDLVAAVPEVVGAPAGATAR